MELHCLKDQIQPKFLEFLPYHFLLSSASKAGFIKYLDVSTGQMLTEIKTKKGEPTSMALNPHNAVVLLGHSSGETTMWTPNFGKPVATMLTHGSAPVTAIAATRCGRYMATTGKDARLKIWDIRNFKAVHDFFTPLPGVSLDFSQSALLSVGYGNEIQVWKDICLKEKQKTPYMKHKCMVAGQRPVVSDVQFVPYEDVLGVAHDLGFSSIVVPGSGEANFDAFEENPFETAKQRQEAEVHKLLEKLQPDSITLFPERIGTIDQAAPEVKEKERREEEEAAIAAKRKKEKKKNKTRGRSKPGHKEEVKVKRMQELQREKNKL